MGLGLIYSNPKSKTHIYIYLNTLPQDGVYKSYAPNLIQIKLIQGLLRDLVRISTN